MDKCIFIYSDLGQKTVTQDVHMFCFQGGIMCISIGQRNCFPKHFQMAEKVDPRYRAGGHK